MERKSIVLDLDETLISSVSWKPNKNIDCVKIKTRSFETQKLRKLWIVKRPGLDEFLKFAGENFNVGVWSAGRVSYVNEIVKNVFPFEPDFIYNYFQCHSDRGRIYKPLRHCPYPDSVLIDDNIYSLDYEYDIDKFILVDPFVYCGEKEMPPNKTLYKLRNVLENYLVNGNIYNSYKYAIHDIKEKKI